MQSSLSSKLHVGIIMDGNGRWAIARGLSRSQGHHAGVETVRRVAEAAPDHGIGTLTLYAFSCDNWRRPPAEVATLMGLLRLYLRTETARLKKDGVRVTAIGRRDRLPPVSLPRLAAPRKRPRTATRCISASPSTTRHATRS